MSTGENSGSIPIDLINEIFSRLPAKSVARFSCLSKQWKLMLSGPYFKELFSTRSSARPRLLFLVKRDGYEDLCLFSSPQPHNLYENKSSSLVVTADFPIKLPKHMPTSNEKHAFGLFLLRVYKGLVICNPSTGQLALLPDKEGLSPIIYLLFDPVDKQFKVLSFNSYKPSLILTLGTGNDSWREIYCPLYPLSTYGLPEGICINGFLYYFATQEINAVFSYPIVCFDVRSEEFKILKLTYRDFIHDRHITKMINYKGKLGVITLERDWNPNNSNGRKCCLKLCMSVLRDADDPNSGWSEHVYTFRKTNGFVGCSNVFNLWENQIVAGDVSVVGVTATGDIVLSMKDASKTLYVFYLNIERKTLQRVEFRTGPNHEEAFANCSSKVILSVDHVEDLNFINMETTYDILQLVPPRHKLIRRSWQMMG